MSGEKRELGGFFKTNSYVSRNKIKPEEADALLPHERQLHKEAELRRQKRQDALDAGQSNNPVVKEADMMYQGGKGAAAGLIGMLAIMGVIALSIFTFGAAMPAGFAIATFVMGALGLVAGGALGAKDAYNKEHEVEMRGFRVSKLERLSQEHQSKEIRHHGIYNTNANVKSDLEANTRALIKMRTDPNTIQGVHMAYQQNNAKEEGRFEKALQERGKASLYTNSL